MEIPGKGKETLERSQCSQQAKGSLESSRKLPASPKDLLDGLQPHHPFKSTGEFLENGEFHSRVLKPCGDSPVVLSVNRDLHPAPSTGMLDDGPDPAPALLPAWAALTQVEWEHSQLAGGVQLPRGSEEPQKCGT